MCSNRLAILDASAAATSASASATVVTSDDVFVDIIM